MTETSSIATARSVLSVTQARRATYVRQIEALRRQIASADLLIDKCKKLLAQYGDEPSRRTA
jgi:hypothetical protein